MRTLIVCSGLLCFLLDTVQAQEKVKFGKVSGEMMRMEVYEADPSAEAVVLYDKGFFNSRSFTFQRHIRIKILKPSGTRWANRTFRIPSKASIKGVVFNMENGELVKEKLANSSIQRQELIKGQIWYKVFMPNVRVGSVIDIQYNFWGLPFEWRFQDVIPVKYSELIINRSEVVHFSVSSFGFEPIQVVQAGTHWRARNMPAFQMEPYMNDYSNFLTKMEFEVESITVPGRIYMEFTTSWDEVNEKLYESDRIYGVLKNTGFLNNFVKSLADLDLSLDEKIDTAYLYVKDHIKWNGHESVIADSRYITNFKKKHVGNSADINLILVSLLQKLGVDAYPVALSTRSNGILNPISPSLNKLNYVIACVEKEDGELLLDATGVDLIPGMLPERCLNGKGRLISEKTARWVDLGTDKSDSKQTMINIEMEDGVYAANLIRRYKDYSYLDFKKRYENGNGEKELIAAVESRAPGVVVNDYKVAFDTRKMSATEEIALDMTELVDDFGGEVLLHPLILGDYKENPFKNPSRKFPVDFIMPKSEIFLVNLKLEDGYEPKSIPEPIRVTTPEKSASFSYNIRQIGETVQIQFAIQINKTIFTETEYEFLRNFYSLLIEKTSQSIELIKKT